MDGIETIYYFSGLVVYRVIPSFVISSLVISSGCMYFFVRTIDI